ncbi:uncharacterized protein BXZ73DRAFT_98729 [Epithele typhae]|uniref:uncharacterized protein n=1 Tax=Epithele typhae TaxID=378194 RepID=UPI0020077CD3|nr:uncharacterized protein BXZ73DRAFT_98729 [Epithele typhae]KAH9940899.1 hypothetical protein BXZ73DRAFT_98729 [Epithele typhae]
MSFSGSTLVSGSWSTPFGAPFFVWNGEGYAKVPIETLRAQYVMWESARLARCAAVVEVGVEVEVEEEAREGPAAGSWADEVEELFSGDISDSLNIDTAGFDNLCDITFDDNDLSWIALDKDDPFLRQPRCDITFGPINIDNDCSWAVIDMDNSFCGDKSTDIYVFLGLGASFDNIADMDFVSLADTASLNVLDSLDSAFGLAPSAADTSMSLDSVLNAAIDVLADLKLDIPTDFDASFTLDPAGVCGLGPGPTGALSGPAASAAGGRLPLPAATLGEDTRAASLASLDAPLAPNDTPADIASRAPAGGVACAPGCRAGLGLRLGGGLAVSPAGPGDGAVVGTARGVVSPSLKTDAISSKTGHWIAVGRVLAGLDDEYEVVDMDVSADGVVSVRVAGVRCGECGQECGRARVGDRRLGGVRLSARKAAFDGSWSPVKPRRAGGFRWPFGLQFKI